MDPLLGDLAGPRAGREAIRMEGAVVTYRELERLARGHAARMRSEGVRAGDRVAVWATPEVPTIAAILGHARMGVATTTSARGRSASSPSFRGTPWERS